MLNLRVKYFKFKLGRIKKKGYFCGSISCKVKSGTALASHLPKNNL